MRACRISTGISPCGHGGAIYGVRACYRGIDGTLDGVAMRSRAAKGIGWREPLAESVGGNHWPNRLAGTIGRIGWREPLAVEERAASTRASTRQLPPGRLACPRMAWPGSEISSGSVRRFHGCSIMAVDSSSIMTHLGKGAQVWPPRAAVTALVPHSSCPCAQPWAVEETRPSGRLTRCVCGFRS